MKNSAADMAAIFGVSVDAYSLDTQPLPPSRINPKKRTTPPDGGCDGGIVAKRKKRRRDDNRYDNYGSSGGDAKKKMNWKRAYNY